MDWEEKEYLPAMSSIDNSTGGMKEKRDNGDLKVSCWIELWIGNSLPYPSGCHKFATTRCSCPSKGKFSGGVMRGDFHPKMVNPMSQSTDGEIIQ